MEADLHCHSTFSDGSASVGLLVQYAIRLGLDVLALTDHDTLKGIKPLRDAARKTGLRIIPGVECTTKDPYTGRPVHVLCYRPSHPEILEELLEETSRRRRNAKLGMIEKIHALYPVVNTQDVLALAEESASIFECHIMNAVANAGITNAPYGELLGQLIGKHGSCYVPIMYPNTLEVIDLMHQAEGTVVIAHPGQFDSMDLLLLLAKERRIDGIECFHYRNTENIKRACLSIAEEYHLLVTGGSDFHGMNTKTPHPLGYCRISGVHCTNFLKALGY